MNKDVYIHVNTGSQCATRAEDGMHKNGSLEMAGTGTTYRRSYVHKIPSTQLMLQIDSLRY